MLVKLSVCNGRLSSAASEAPDEVSTESLAERYVHLVLAMGQHDKDYVDAFYGPEEWKTAAEKGKKPLDTIREEAMQLAASDFEIADAGF